MVEKASPSVLIFGNIRKALNDILPLDTFGKNVITLMTGTIFAQGLMVLVAPILTRIYSPEDFGIFTLFISVLSLLSVMACMRLEIAIVLPEEDEDAANLLVLSMIICLGMSFLTLFLIVLRTPIANLVGAPELSCWLWLMPISMFLTGIFQSLNYWCVRRKNFKRLAARTVIQSGITSVAQIGAGLFYTSASAGGLIGGTVAGQLAATCRLVWQVRKDDGLYIREHASIRHMVSVLKRYRNFPFFDLWSALLNTASTILPALLLGVYFTPAVVGYYALSNRVLALPMSLVGASVARVFYPQANEAKYNSTLNRLTLEMFEKLLQMGFVPILLITIVAPDLFAVVFGDSWWTAGEYVRWLSLWMLFVFISSPLSNLYHVLERQRDLLIVNIVMFISRLIVLVIGGIMGDAWLSITLFGSTGAVLWMFNCAYILFLAGVSARDMCATICNTVIRGVPYGVFPLVIWYGTDNSEAFLLAAVTAGIVFTIIKIHSAKVRGCICD